VCGRAAASAAFANWRDRTAPSGSGQVKTHQTIFSINNDNQLGGGAQNGHHFQAKCAAASLILCHLARNHNRYKHKIES